MQDCFDGLCGEPDCIECYPENICDACHEAFDVFGLCACPNDVEDWYPGVREKRPQLTLIQGGA